MFRTAGCRTAFPVETLLIPASPVRSIVLPATLVGILATMVLTATELAAKIPPIRVPRMRQKADPTMAAVDRTACQTGMIAQDGIERQLILTNERASAIILMPIVAKRKNFGQRYDKNARFSVKMLICLCISSSYELDAKTSRSRARIFYAALRKSQQPTGATHLFAHHWPATTSYPNVTASRPTQFPALLGNRKENINRSRCGKDSILLFQVVGPIS